MPDEDRFLIGRGLGVLWEPFPVNKCEFQFGGLRKSGLFSQTSDFFFDVVVTQAGGSMRSLTVLLTARG